MFAVLRVRGTSKLDRDVNDTLDILRLKKPHQCVILPESPVYLGMLRKAHHCITWGEIKPQILEALIEKLGKMPGAKKIDAKAEAKTILEGKIKSNILPVFKLGPPKKGFRRKGILHGFNQGGELGYRGEKINSLLEKMI